MSKEDVKDQNKETPSTPGEKGDPITKPEESKTPETIPYSRFSEVIAQKNKLQERLEAKEKADNEAEESKLKEQNEFKELYEKEKEKSTNLETAFKSFKITNSLKVEAMKQGIIDIDGINFVKPDSVKFDNEGNPENAEELVKGLKKEKPYLFKVTDNKQEQPFAPDSFQPSSNTSKTPVNLKEAKKAYYETPYAERPTGRVEQ